MMKQFIVRKVEGMVKTCLKITGVENSRQTMFGWVQQVGTSSSCPPFVANPFQRIRFNCFFVGIKRASLPSAFEYKLESQYVGCQTTQIF